MKEKLINSKMVRIYKGISKFLILLIICLILFIGGSFMFSSRIGDWYYRSKEFDKAMIWYELNYEYLKPDATLLKICNLLRVTNEYSLQVKYYQIILGRKELVTTEEYRAFLSEYISALYFSGKIAEYKEMYSSRIDLLVAGSEFLTPLDAIIFDENAREEDVRWAIERIDSLHNRIGEPSHLSTLFYQQAKLYLKLGEKEKADQLFKQSELAKK